MELDLDGLQLLPGEEAQLHFSPDDERCTISCGATCTSGTCEETCIITG